MSSSEQDEFSRRLRTVFVDVVYTLIVFLSPILLQFPPPSRFILCGHHCSILTLYFRVLPLRSTSSLPRRSTSLHEKKKLCAPPSAASIARLPLPLLPSLTRQHQSTCRAARYLDQSQLQPPSATPSHVSLFLFLQTGPQLYRSVHADLGHIASFSSWVANATISFVNWTNASPMSNPQALHRTLVSLLSPACLLCQAPCLPQSLTSIDRRNGLNAI